MITKAQNLLNIVEFLKIRLEKMTGELEECAGLF